MTISSTISRWEYTGDGSTTVFAYTNKIFADAELEVYSDNVLQTLTTDYTVSGAGVETGGNVTYVTAPASGVEVVIIRVVADTQSTDYPAGGSLPSGVIENDIDRRTIVSQQQEEKFSRTMLTPAGETQIDMTLPTVANRANKFLGWDGVGAPAALSESTGSALDLTKILGGVVGTELTISGGSITPARAVHAIDTEADAASDNLDNIGITGLDDGALLLIRAIDTTHTVVIRHNQAVSNPIITLDGSDITLDTDKQSVLLRRSGTVWVEIGAIGDLTARVDKVNAFSKTQSWAKGADVASASPLVLGTDGNYFDVTGTTGFSSITVAAGTLFMLQFDGALTLTHGASLDLPGEANITTAAGDRLIGFAEAANTVQVLSYAKADGSSVFAGKVVQVVNTQTGAVATGTTVLPFDDTIPQNTEGDEYMTLAITPKSTSNILVIDVVWVGATSAIGTLGVALFQDSTADALAVTADGADTVNNIQTTKLTHKMTAGTTSATTFKVRAGQQNANTTTFNGTSGARRYGGLIASSITITEYLP